MRRNSVRRGALLQDWRTPAVLEDVDHGKSLCDGPLMGGNSLVADEQPGLISRCGLLLASSMQRSGGSFCPTITFEEALRREMEYRRRLEMTHPHLLVALNRASDTQKFEEVVAAIPDILKRKLAPESSVSAQQSSFSCATAQRQPQNWYRTKKKVKVPQSPSQILQCPRPNVVPSFWCKICKVDCVTEFNFGAHIGGKKHKAKKLEILGNRNTGRPANQCAGTRNRGQNVQAVSGSRSNESNALNVAAGPICDLSSESRTGGTNES